MKRVIVVALVAALAAAALPAPALADATLQPTGALIYTWHGDPARGCARMGVCGIQGVLIIRPQDGIDVAQSGPRSASFELGAVSQTVRVRRTDPGSSGNCVDTGGLESAADGSIGVRWSAAGAVQISLAGLLSVGRCAGPLATELGALAVHGRRGGGKQPSYDLADTVPFAAGPYSGTLVSTLHLTPVSAAENPLFSGSGGSGGGSEGGSGTASRRQRIEQLTLEYHLKVAPAVFTLSFSGQTDPLCDPFDACGVHGAVSLSLGARQSSLTLTALRPAPRHVGRREALAAFAAGRFGSVEPSPGPSLSMGVTETLARPGSTTCVDGVASTAALVVGAPVQTTKGAVAIAISPNAPSDTLSIDPLRTHCAGPAMADMLGLFAGLAQVTAGPRSLLASRTTLLIRARGAFAGGGYVGARTGSMAVTLTLRKVRVSTFNEAEFAGDVR